ncbi:hypothetical protein ACFVU0_14025 [Streptomyces sp. NPDC058122]|uniref:hypothetical protein n=1 Tax=Streptomyces sp. NPDC058122 TaxID=3346349 RepID=UPI0036E6229E
MALWQCALYGAAGGALAGLVDFYQRYMAWRALCGARLAQEPPGTLPPLNYTRQDFFGAALHVVLGCVGGLLFGGSGQVEGQYPILVVGASAPALLFNVVSGSVTPSPPMQPQAPTQPAGTPDAAAGEGGARVSN